MRSFTAGEAAAAYPARVTGDPGAVFRGMTFDSREVREGNLFVALKGERTDGNEFVGKAYAAGASAAMGSVTTEPPAGKAFILSDSPELSLRFLARAARESYGGTLVGIVGSAGKTTTKDFCAAFLSLSGRTYSSSGNRNNLLGLPETIVNADFEAGSWVLEMGISKPGEMDELAAVAMPNGVVLTSIKPVHTEFLGSLENIRNEKSRVLSHLRAPSFCVYNCDDPMLASIEFPAGTETASFGFSESADLRISIERELGVDGFRARFAFRGEEIVLDLPFLNRANCLNFGAALLLALTLGSGLGIAAEALPLLRPAAHRGVVHRLAGDVVLYDDSYNSNPEAVKMLMKSASGWGRRVVGVLGEMRELGADSPAYHRETGRAAAEVLSALLCVGGDGAAFMEEGFAVSGKPCSKVDRWEDGLGFVRSNLAPGTALLVKGSRAIALDGLADLLSAEGAGP